MTFPIIVSLCFLSAGAADVRRVEPILREDEAALVPRALPLPLPHPPRRHTRMPQTQVSPTVNKSTKTKGPCRYLGPRHEEMSSAEKGLGGFHQIHAQLRSGGWSKCVNTNGGCVILTLLNGGQGEGGVQNPDECCVHYLRFCQKYPKEFRILSVEFTQPGARLLL